MTTYQAYPVQPTAAPKRRKLLLVLLAALLGVALLIGIAALAMYFNLRDDRPLRWTWQDPLSAVDSSRVRPDLAVIALLDLPNSNLVQQSILANEPDTAYAVLVYDPSDNDAARSGSAQLVGKAFEAIPLRDLAALSYQQMLDTAALSPTMADPMRAQVTLDAARGFLRLGMTEAVSPALQQAETLARYSPLIAPVQRQDVARQLQAIYRELGQPDTASTLDQLVREPRGVPTSKFVRGPFLPQFVGHVTLSAELQGAVDTRREQVYAFLRAWDSGDPTQIEAARSQLAGALLAEDALRTSSLVARSEQAVDLYDKAAVALDQVQWLMQKFMLASGAVGYNLVPEWVQAREQIAADLRASEEMLFGLYRDQAGRLTDADDAGSARVEILRQQLLLGRLGLYPGYEEEALATALDQAQREASTVLPLLVVPQEWGAGYVFRIAETFE